MNMLRTREETPLIIRSAAGMSPARKLSAGSSGGAGAGGFSGQDIMRMLRRRKWLIIICLFIFLVISGVSSFLWNKMAPIYKAQALIVVYPPVASELALNVGPTLGSASKSLLETRVKSIHSESVFENAIKSIKGTKWFEKNNADGEGLVKLMDAVDVGIVPNTNFIYISMTGLDREDITVIVNAIAEAAEKDASLMQSTDKQKQIERLQETVQKKSQEKEEAVRIIKTLRAGPTRLDPSTIQIKHGMLVKEMELANKQYAQALSMWDGMKSRTDKEIAEMPEIQYMVLNNPEVSILKNRILNIEFELDYALKTLGEKHNTVKSLKNRLEIANTTYKEKYDEVMAKTIKETKELREQEFIASEKYREDISTQLNESDRAMKELHNIETALSDAANTVSNCDQEINALNYRIMDLRLLLKGETPVVLQHKARKPIVPVYPQMPIMIALGAFLGLFFGGGLALLLEMLDTSIKSAEDVVNKVQLPVMGIVPHEDDVDEDIDDMRLAFLSHPNTIICEAFRQIRTTLLFSGQVGQHSSVLITSPMPSDGRTTVTLNLASHLVKGGMKVLVVEANFRQPVIRHLFKNDCPKNGLSSILQGTANWEECLFTVNNEFDVISAGSIPQNPTELLGSNEMASLAEELASRYDMVLYDSSPCLIVSDASVLSTRVDGVLFTFRAGVSTFNMGQRSRAMFEQLGAHIYGAVINGMKVNMEGSVRKDYETFYEYSSTPQSPAV
ncbi:MAG TPA: polysaccharide biosynthesis tyrosine autokinase [Phycisphaerae bacterium]|nr:polysaccharide biosynthesis tyrosine autokinase [Phycisphaerae bacterium]